MILRDTLHIVEVQLHAHRSSGRSHAFSNIKKPSIRWRMRSLGPQVILRELVW